MATFTKVKHRAYLVFFVLAVFATSLLNQATAQQPAADLDQIRNGGATQPLDPATWVNGNAGAQTAHYLESHSIAYRCRMTAMPAGTVVNLTLGYDIRHSSRNAIDYLTHYDRIQPHAQFGHDPNIPNKQEEIDPTDGTPFDGQEGSPTSTFLIPEPSSAGSPIPGVPGSSYNALKTANAAQLHMTMWGGTITNIQYAVHGSLTAKDAETRIIVTFTTDSDGGFVLLAWGGHIASRQDWGFDQNGVPNSAGGISGSPYHMRLKDWNLNNLGNQDRSLAAAAVQVCDITPGTIAGDQSNCGPFDPAAFTSTAAATGNGTISYQWQISTTSCTAGFSDIAGATLATYDAPTVNVTTYFRRKATNVSGFLTCSEVSNCVTVTMNNNPDAPTVVIDDVEVCETQTAPTATVCSPVVGLYKLNQTGQTEKTFNYDGTNGPVIFTLVAGIGGFSLTVTVNGCTSDAATCLTDAASCGTTTQANPTQEVQTIDAKIIGAAKTKVLAAPNPFTNRVRFTLQSDVSGMGSLEIFNTMGQKIATVYQGYVEAGKPLNKEYVAQRALRANLIYVFRVGDQKTTGKLLNW